MAKVKSPNFAEINKVKPSLVYKKRKTNEDSFTHDVKLVKPKAKIKKKK